MLPVLLAVGMSLRHDGFSLWLALVAAFGVGCAHLGMNLADDYFDYREGSAEKRTRLASDGIRARVAKYPYLSSGAASVRELVVAVCVFLGLAAGAGASSSPAGASCRWPSPASGRRSASPIRAGRSAWAIAGWANRSSGCCSVRC